MTLTEITSEAELREALGGSPGQRAATKVRTTLHPSQADWLRMSPFCVIHVLDETTVAVPERPGNKRADGYLNVLSNPHVGIISLIPGREDTLRINGRARLVRDAPFFADLEVRGQRPVLAMIVRIDQVFFHCAKAFMRSRLWQPQSWPSAGALPSVAALCKTVQDTPETLEELQAHYAPEHYSRLLLADLGVTITDLWSQYSSLE
jgi:PPOX class probable FMN-dependent enzyme